MATNAFELPKVGDGATYNVGSDRYAATVIKVTPRTVTIQDDIAKATLDSNYFGDQKYTYTPDPSGGTNVARWSPKRGWRIGKYTGVGFGHRSQWQNPSF